MSPISVLIVDNNPIFLGAATQFLNQQDPDRVTVAGTATDGETAITLVQALQPEVVLLDLSMPGLSGLETLPLLKDAMPNVIVIILTLLDTAEYRQAALSAGADAFVPKAVLSTELMPAIWNSAARTDGTPAESAPVD